MTHTRGRREAGASSEPRAEPTASRSWLWWRQDRGARSRALEEFEKLPVHGRAGLSKVIERYLAGESRFKDVDALGGDILEIRYGERSNHYRVLFMLWGKHCVGLTAFYKNQQRTPQTDLDRARQRARRWRQVHGERPPGS